MSDGKTHIRYRLLHGGTTIANEFDTILGTGTIFASMLGGWTPADITNAVAWFRADDVVTSGSDVTTWTDKIGSNDLTGGTAPESIATVAAINNQPAVSFVGTSTEYLDAASLTFSAGYDVYFIGMFDNNTLNNCMADSVSTNNEHIFYIGSPSNISMYTGASLTDAAAVGGTWSLFRNHWNGATSTIEGYGSSKAGDTGAVGGTGFRVGRGGGTNTRYLTGDIAEIIVCSSALSAGDRTELDAYITARYGI